MILMLQCNEMIEIKWNEGKIQTKRMKVETKHKANDDDGSGSKCNGKNGNWINWLMELN